MPRVTTHTASETESHTHEERRIISSLCLKLQEKSFSKLFHLLQRNRLGFNSFSATSY